MSLLSPAGGCSPRAPGPAGSKAERGWAHAAHSSGPSLALVTCSCPLHGHAHSRGSRLIPNPVGSLELPWTSCSLQHPTPPALSLQTLSDTRHSHSSPFLPTLSSSPPHPSTSLPQSQDAFPASYSKYQSLAGVAPPGSRSAPFPYTRPSGFQPVMGSSCPGKSSHVSPMSFLGFHLCKGVQWIVKAPAGVHQEC